MSDTTVNQDGGILVSEAAEFAPHLQSTTIIAGIDTPGDVDALFDEFAEQMTTGLIGEPEKSAELAIAFHFEGLLSVNQRRVSRKAILRLHRQSVVDFIPADDCELVRFTNKGVERLKCKGVPSGTKVANVIVNDMGDVCLLLEHESFPLVEEGGFVDPLFPMVSIRTQTREEFAKELLAEVVEVPQ